MDIADIISRLEVVIENIEYEEISIAEVQDNLKSLVNDIEFSTDFDADFGNIQFDDLD
tara:strand:+ start:177 stop:350 length:174 start_codon:yes stop_codon:yes gene_type:complete